MEESNNVKLSEREIVGAYSVDRNGHYIDGENFLSNLKYLKVPNSLNNINLNAGEYDDGGESYDPMERLNFMTDYIKQNSTKFVKNERIDADFVCFRGGLKNIMSSPYLENDWIVKAVKLKETIYFILELKGYENKNDISKSFGFKFESYMVASKPYLEPPGASLPVYKREEFCVLMSRKVDDYKILFGAEIDGVNSKSVIGTLDELKTSNLIEIKLRKYKEGPNKLDANRSIEWWCQSCIASVDIIHVGIHDQGVIKNLETLQTKKLQHKYSPWSRSECIKQLKKLLTYIKDKMEEIDDPKIGLSFEWKGKSKEFADIKVIEGFLPLKYIEFINKLKPNKEL
ncbi:unnamed protein product [Chironomus riparius]|uniref:Decapping nuclease n=1 Tax=Chironomus riparius TaxID=315576 RepID=A0A9N9WWV3_9DIPT|nr:unnamed protein product [Chironomus riparius]